MNPFSILRQENKFSILHSPFSILRKENKFSILNSPFSILRKEKKFSILNSPFSIPQLFLHFVFCILLSFTLFSCSTSTKPETGSLSGKVILVNDTGDPAFDPVDYSGITVALYNLAYLDTTIVRINNQYPQIGVQINQETEFDHRYQQPIAKTITNTDGSFKLTEIISGEYNLVYFKSGWGIRYVYHIVINKGENIISDIYEQITDDHKISNMIEGSKAQKTELVLYPMKYLSSTIQNAYVFQEDHCYLIIQDTSFLSAVVFQYSAFVFVNPGCRIDFWDSVSMPESGKRWWITSSEGIFKSELNIPGDDDNILKIRIANYDGNIIRNGKISHLMDGLEINSDDTIITKMVFTNGFTAIVLNGNSLNINQTLIKSFKSRTNVFYGNSNISQNIFYNNYDNLIIDSSDFNVNNNYFISNWVGIRPIYGNTIIRNNCFWNNDYGISMVASNPLIEYNEFFGSKRYCIQTQPNYVQASLEFCNPVIKHNNIYATDQIAISIKPDAHDGYYASGNIGVINDIDATYNYWRAIDIDNVLYDELDSDEVHYKILFNPRINAKILSAGIQ